MPEYTTFGDYVRALRVALKLGLREAAKLLDISPGYLSRLEASEVRPPAGEKLHRFVRVYGADIHRLMELASTRAGEAMAADQAADPALQAFYRLAQDQTPDNQEKMLRGAIDALNLPEDQKVQLLQTLRAALSRSHGKDLPRLARGEDGMFAFDVKPRFLSATYIESIAERVLSGFSQRDVPLPVPIEDVVDDFGPDIQLIVLPEIEGGYLQDGTPAVLGLSRWSKSGERRELVIHEDLYDAADSSARRLCRFTLAHELFHCLEHLSLVKDRTADCALKRQAMFVSLAPKLAARRWFDRKKPKRTLTTNEDWREWQANSFASAVLMPAAVLRTKFAEVARTTQVTVSGSDRVECVADEVARQPFIDAKGKLSSLVDHFNVNPHAMAIRLMALKLVTR